MKGLLATTRAKSRFDEAPRRNRRSNKIRTNALPKRQDFVLEPLESRLLLSVTTDFVGPVALSEGTIVNVSQALGNQTEGTIAVDPTSPNEIFAASNPSTSAANSTNAGSTFTNPPFNSFAGLLTPPDRPCCDNVAVWDNFGNLFVVSLGVGPDGTIAPGGDADDTIILETSTTGAAGSFTLVATLATGFVDQPSIAVGHDSVWVTYNQNGTIFARGAAVTGLGAVGAFTAAEAATGSNGVDGQFGDIAVNPVSGAVVVTYQSDTQIFTNTDIDGLGAGGFAAQVPVTNTNVAKFDNIAAQPQRSIDAEANLTYGPDGTLYMVYTDEQPDESDDTDIFVLVSTDDGATWPDPAVQVNDDAGNNSQFLPEIAVDPMTGYVGVAWHDARFDNGQNDGIDDHDGVANNEANFFAALSTDGGLTFGTNVRLTPSASNANVGAVGTFDFGDYTGLNFFGGVLRPVWGDNSNSTGDNPAGTLQTLDLYTVGVTVAGSGGVVVNVFGDEDFTNESDNFRIVLDPSGTFVQFFINDVLEFTYAKNAIRQINVFGLGGNDNLTVDSTNGLISLGGLGSIPNNGIQYDGATGFNRLSLLQTGGLQQSDDTYSVGPAIGSGNSTIEGSTGTQTVFFENLSPVLDLVPSASLTVNATSANNAISYLVGPTSTNNGLVAIDDQEPIEFSNKDTLTINAKEGSDTISLNNPNTPTSLTEIFINGGDPSGVDTLSVTGGGDVTYTPSASDGGLLELTSSPVKINGIEILSYDGQGSNGSLTIVGTSGDDRIVHTPDANDQAGTFQVNSLLALSYQNLGSGGSLTADGGTGTDTLVYNGTNANDTFTIDGTGNIGDPGLVQLNSRLTLNTASVEALTLEGFDGDDSFTLKPAISASVYQLINLNGGGQASAIGDRVYLIGTTGADNIAISGQLVRLGVVTINGSGIEAITLDAQGGDDSITYTGVEGVKDDITITASSSLVAGAGQISVPGVTLATFTGVEWIDVNGNTGADGDEDTLTFAGTNDPDTFNIDLAAAGTSDDPILTLLQNGSLTPLLTLRSYTNFNTLNVFGLDGADTFNVYTSATIRDPDVPERNLFVDGGLPSGKKKSTDNLNIFYTLPRPKIIQSAATQDPVAGIVDLDYDTARFEVKYDGIEQVVIRKG
jgi:hypothetical protein